MPSRAERQRRKRIAHYATAREAKQLNRIERQVDVEKILLDFADWMKGDVANYESADDCCLSLFIHIQLRHKNMGDIVLAWAEAELSLDDKQLICFLSLDGAILDHHVGKLRFCQQYEESGCWTGKTSGKLIRYQLIRAVTTWKQYEKYVGSINEPNAEGLLDASTQV
jgi:hypothetical protein